MKTVTHQQLIQRLIERGWMPIQIAREIRVSKSTISRLQNTPTEPSFRTGQALRVLVASRKKPPKGKSNGTAE
jgi:IS30 family transposase